MIDLTKLSEAVTKVAGLAKDASDARAEASASRAALVDAQTAVDALAAQLIAAVDTPAEAVGLAAVAAALVPVAPVLPEPQTVDELNARIAAMNAGIAV